MFAYELLTSATLTRTDYAVGDDGKNFTNPCCGPDGNCYAKKWDIIGALAYCYSYKKAKFIKDMIWIRVMKLRTPTGDLKYYDQEKAAIIVFNDHASIEEITTLLKAVEHEVDLMETNGQVSF